MMNFIEYTFNIDNTDYVFFIRNNYIGLYEAKSLVSVGNGWIRNGICNWVRGNIGEKLTIYCDRYVKLLVFK